jgi:hypothetical protein
MSKLASERRQSLRVLAVWRSIAGDGFPRRSQVDPNLFGGDWANCLIVDVDPVIERSRIAFLGENLRDPTWPTFDRQCIAECPEGTLLQLATRGIADLVAKRAPIGQGGPALYYESPILYRSILLPLSESGAAIDGVLGVVNFREVAADKAAAPERLAVAAL